MAQVAAVTGVSHRARLDTFALDAHDAQKDWPDALWDDLVAGFGPLLGPTCLEIGVGSGLVASRLARLGGFVAGVDFNRSMLERLLDRTAQVAVAEADALALPVRSGSCSSVVVSNVLHLVENWTALLTEARSVLAPGGSLLVNLGSGGAAPAEVGDLRRRFLASLPDPGPGLGPSSVDELVAACAQLGLGRREPVVASGHIERSLRQVIERLERNPFAWPPGYPIADLRQAAKRARAEATDRHGTIDQPLPHRIDVTFEIFRASADV